MANDERIETDGHQHLKRVEIWYCSGCNTVHLGVGETCVNFDRQLFSEFAEMVAGTNMTVLRVPAISTFSTLLKRPTSRNRVNASATDRRKVR